jgi:hypothetical protein
VEPERPEPDDMPCKLGWLKIVTEPLATMASACMCMAKAYTCTRSISLPAKARLSVSMLMLFGLMSPVLDNYQDGIALSVAAFILAQKPRAARTRLPHFLRNRPTISGHRAVIGSGSTSTR